jgi:hypothetical protein
LVKDYNNRIDWKEIFDYTITEGGDIYPPGVTPGAGQVGLRQSIRNSSGFGQGLTFTQPGSSGGSTSGSSTANTSLNDSLKGLPVSPKIGKMDSKDEDSGRQQFLMKKRSPTKVYEEKETAINMSVNFNQNTLMKN